MSSTESPDLHELSAWLDGELDPDRAAQVEAWLRDHPEQAAQARLWAADRDALRARLGPVLDEAVPPALLQTVASGARLPAPIPARRGWRPAQAAALLLGGTVLGLVLGAGLVSRSPGTLAALPQPWRPPALATTNWQHRAAVAHAVYAPEVRHPVEVDVKQGSVAEQRAQEEHLARWLGKRLGMAVRLFDLRAHGFELVGGRLLPDLAGPSAQLMYQNAEGQRVTLYLRRPEAGTEAGFRFQREGELNLFSWVEDGFACAMVGKLPREQLLAMANEVYRQAEPAITPSPPKPVPAS